MPWTRSWRHDMHDARQRSAEPTPSGRGHRRIPLGDPARSRSRRSHCRLGNALIRKGKLDEASAAYREAIRLKPDDAEGHYGLGNALKGQGKLDDAIAEYREAIRLKPDHAEAHCNLGSALKGQGKLDEASAGYREAIRLKPDYAEAHSNLGGILKSRGDDAGALAMYRKWREINNTPPASTLQQRSGRKPWTGSRPSATPGRSGWMAATRTREPASCRRSGTGRWT